MIKISRRQFTIGSAAMLTATSLPLKRVFSHPKTLKIGVLLPQSGHLAQIGQACARGADIAPEFLGQTGASIQIMHGDTETNVNVARNQAEKMISEGAHVIVGAYNSSETATIAQVCEQKGVPFVINIAAAEQITESGYKYVFRNFPTGKRLAEDGLKLMKDLFKATGQTPKTAVVMYVNSTFGQSVKRGIDAAWEDAQMPFKLLDAIPYDPKARDLSIEVARAKREKAELLIPITNLNDAISIIRECVKQRYEPMGIISPGSGGMYEQQFFENLKKYSEYCITNTAWYNPKSPLYGPLVQTFQKKFPKNNFDMNVGYTFEAIMIAADAHKRAQTTNPKELRDALSETYITENLMYGGPIQFDKKGQNNNLRSVGLQNRDRRPQVILPTDIAETTPTFPMPPWRQR